MNPIALSKPGDTGAGVANLQDGLAALLGKRVIKAFSAPIRPTVPELQALTEGLKEDRARPIFGEATAKLVGYFQVQQGLGDALHGVVEEKTATKLNELLRGFGLLDEAAVAGFVVSGHVDGARPGLRVVAYDVDFRSEQPLGESSIDADGKFEILYSAEQFKRAEKGTADLRVAILEPGGRELVSSELTFNAGPTAEVNLTLGTGAGSGAPSEYERHLADLADVLQGVTLLEIAQGTPDAQERDLDFLSGDTGIDRTHLAWLVRAAALVQESSPAVGPKPARPVKIRTTGDASNAIPDVAFYGWLRMALPETWEALRAVPMSRLRAALVDAVAQNIIPSSVSDQLDAILSRVPNPQQGDLRDLLGGTAWTGDRVAVVLGHVDGATAVSNKLLTDLVAKQALKPEEAQKLGLTVSLQRFTGAAPAAVAQLLTTQLPAAAASPLLRASDLAALEPADWQTALAAANVLPPDGMSPEEHARTVAMQATGAFPEVAFRTRAVRVPQGITQDWQLLRPLLAKNPNLFALPYDELDLSDISPDGRDGFEEAHAILRDLVNVHPGLGLGDVFATQAPSDAARITGERIGMLDTVFQKNPNANFLALDYLPDSVALSRVDFGDLSADDRKMVVRDLKASQRMHGVTGNAIPAYQLMKAGYSSASAMAMSTPSEVAETSGVAENEAFNYHAAAVQQANAAALDWFGIYDTTRDSKTTPTRVIPTHDQFFHQLDGYAQLVNDQPWCACDECQSVLSPAAYFVDLMHYIEQNILKQSFAGREDHPLHLQKRRPDLWDLELTCANTNDAVPYLDIVVEILEAYLVGVVPFADATALYKALAQEERSFAQPFTLPLERLTVLLGHFNLTRYDVATAMGVGADVQARARLGLTPKDYTLITTERVSDRAFLVQMFGLPSTVTTLPDFVIPGVALAVLVKAIDLPHDTVAAALQTKFVNTDGANLKPIVIKLGKRDPDDVQNNTEVVYGLTLHRLDRLHRFIRLWRTLPWTIAELDYALARLSAPAAVASIAPAPAGGKGTPEQIVDLLAVDAWSLPLDDLMAMSDAFPPQPLRGEPESLFDRLFNEQAFASKDGLWPPAAPFPFTHPSWTAKLGAGPPSPVGHSIPADNTLTRLLAGLQLADGDFVNLVAGLAPLHVIDHQPATAAAPESIAISDDSLAALYRHARLRNLLGVSVADFLMLLRLAALPAHAGEPAGFIWTLADVRAVSDLATWQKTSGFTFDQIRYLTNATVAGDVDPQALAAAVVAAAQTEHSLDFAGTLFTELGLTEQQSRDLVAANLTVPAAADTLPFETTDSGYRVRAIGLGGLVIPAALAKLTSAAAVTELVADLEALRVLDVALGRALARPLPEVAALRAVAEPVLDTPAVARAIQGGTDAADVGALLAVITKTARFDVLFGNAIFDVAGLEFVAAAPAVFFGAGTDTPLTATPAIKLDVLRNVAAYVGLAAPTDAGFASASGPADLGAIQSVVVGVAAASDADLAKALRTDEARIGALRPHLTLPSGPLDALGVLRHCLAVADLLGVSGETLQRMFEESSPAATFDALSRAAEDVFAAFRTKYPDEQTFQDKLEPFEDKLRGRRRDGLVDYLVARWPTPFSDPNKLYEYFLVDVLMEGCGRTSRVVLALSSLQLYVQRVLMNLERSADYDPLDPKHTGVRASFGDATARAEWAWRQYFRVWQANRRVFLYPENYLEPELRDDKTPLFKDLEDTLLQQEIDAANVQSAYSRFLTGFDELAGLRIAGGYYDVDTSKLHLFGVTQDDAPVYYYREVDDVGWDQTPPLIPQFSPWQKVTVQIPVRTVSPIVFDQRLYVFWVETTTRPVNEFSGGSSVFGGYRHTVRIKFTMLRPDGTWTAPQIVKFSEGGATSDARVVEDPIDRSLEEYLNAEITAAQALRDAYASQVDNLQGTTGQPGPVPLADQARDKAIQARVKQQNIVNGPPTDAEVAAAAAALFFTGTPYEVTISLMRAGEYILLRSLEADEARAIEVASALDAQLAEAQKREDEQNALLTMLNDALADAINKETVRWDNSRRHHSEPIDNYKPEGWQWDRPYPEITSEPDDEPAMRITFLPKGDEDADALADVDDFDASAGLMIETSDNLPGRGNGVLNWTAGFLTDAVLPPQPHHVGQSFYVATKRLHQPDSEQLQSTVAVGPFPAEAQIVNGALDSAILEWKGDSVWMRPLADGTYGGVRLTTTQTKALARRFWNRGVDDLLDADFQQKLEETWSALSPIVGQGDPKRRSPFHPDAANHLYYREMFFHIPFSVANHLNGEGKFADTQRWYHYIFDPTAAEGDPWRYREFREPTAATTTLRRLLTDRQSLAAYREHPFSPHAIARTRMTAYQKAIVMKYVDNLLDWGDSLFNQFTTESLNEATMLYVMAQDILGPRPAVLGSCGEGGVSPKTYRKIAPGLGDVSDFLVELETPHALPAQASAATNTNMVAETQTVAQANIPSKIQQDTTVVGQPNTSFAEKANAETIWTSVGGTSLGAMQNQPPPDATSAMAGVEARRPPQQPAPPQAPVQQGAVGTSEGQQVAPFTMSTAQLETGGTAAGGPVAVAAQQVYQIVPTKNLVFCIPPNTDLLAYWSRVEDRLYKIRNCMDITGLRRQPELFAPPIDPRLLVRMTAAGLSIDDVLNATSGNLPPYRFTYLIEKARQHASMVQSFGAQLLAAFEKGDTEQLNQLRTVHEQNVLTMQTKSAELEIAAAEDTLDSLRQQKAAAEYRRQHFVSLREIGQIAGERKQQDLQGEASNFRTAAGIAQVVASVLTIIPDTGAPTAMKFGGSQLGAAGRAVAEGLNAVAAYNEMAAARAGVQASNQRRDQEWAHQAETARLESLQIDKNIAAAEIRRDITLNALEINQKSVTQSEELFDFYRDKFSSVDRYQLLSKDLRRLHRLAFNSALAVARMAEQAYRLERPDDDSLLDGNYWDADNAGLLAGEKLAIDLQRFERQFIETNYRELEVEQSFSLAQLAPDQLATLRLTGECSFSVPEWFFDLTYPGQYRRRLRAVRVTIPCIAGPYVNIGATLRLTSSQIRLSPPPIGQPLDPLTDVPLRHTTAIATSRAQNDGGVFEFNFRDERYVPFEGAGAIGSWQVSLPRTIRMFDYATINDVILHLSYTADYDEGLRQLWDETTRMLIDLLSKDDPKSGPPLARSFSLHSEFPDVFNRLLTSPVGTEVDLILQPRHLPLFVGGRAPVVSKASLQIVSPLAAMTGAKLAIGQKAVPPAPQAFKEVAAPTDATTGSATDDLRSFDADATPAAGDPKGSGVSGALLGGYVIKIVAAGALNAAPPATAPIDPSKLRDIVLRVGYRLGP